MFERKYEEAKFMYILDKVDPAVVDNSNPPTFITIFKQSYFLKVTTESPGVCTGGKMVSLCYNELCTGGSNSYIGGTFTRRRLDVAEFMKLLPYNPSMSNNKDINDPDIGIDRRTPKNIVGYHSVRVGNPNVIDSFKFIAVVCGEETLEADATHPLANKIFATKDMPEIEFNLIGAFKSSTPLPNVKPEDCPAKTFTLCEDELCAKNINDAERFDGSQLNT